MAQRNAVRPGDVTGTEKARLARENADKIAARSAELAMDQQALREVNEQPVDLTQGPNAVLNEIEEVEVVEVDRAPVKIRVNSDLENMTFGAGNHYDFEEGRTYVVPAELADHLEEKGYLWH